MKSIQYYMHRNAIIKNLRKQCPHQTYAERKMLAKEIIAFESIPRCTLILQD